MRPSKEDRDWAIAECAVMFENSRQGHRWQCGGPAFEPGDVGMFEGRPVAMCSECRATRNQAYRRSA